jgi:hypothetical protein
MSFSGMEVINMKIYKALVTVIFLLLSFVSHSEAGWQLYDNFDSGTIDPQKWGIDDSSASITVENGRVKIRHNGGFSNDNNWIYIKSAPDTIRGLKATITVTSCSGDVRARLGGFVGKKGDDIIWASQEIRPSNQYIASAMNVLGSAPDYPYKSDYFWGHFRYPISTQNIPYTISMIFSLDELRCDVDGLGAVEYAYPNALSKTDDNFKGIGTRSNTGSGTCTVYIDDVYIYRQSPSPATNILLLGD